MATQLLKIQPMWTTSFIVLVPEAELMQRVNSGKPFINPAAVMITEPAKK